MLRRAFLKLLGLGALGAAAPAKASPGCAHDAPGFRVLTTGVYEPEIFDRFGRLETTLYVECPAGRYPRDLMGLVPVRPGYTRLYVRVEPVAREDGTPEGKSFLRYVDEKVSPVRSGRDGAGCVDAEPPVYRFAHEGPPRGA